MINLSVLKSPTLFWQLFISLLAVLMLTAISTVALERYWASRTLDKVMQTHLDHLVSVRQNVAIALADDDWQSVRTIYRQDPRLLAQLQITDGNGTVLTPSFVPDSKHTPNRRDHPRRNPNTFNQTDRPNDRQSPFAPIEVDTTLYPELASVSVSSPTTDYVIHLSPRLPLHDVRKAERNQGNWLLSVLASLLICVVVCYVLSRVLIRRITTVQHMVQRLSQQTANTALLSAGQTNSNTQQHAQWQHDLERLQALGDDELGQLGKDVAVLSNRLADSEKARQQMLSDISHELRSPLARLDVATELIRDRLQSEPIAESTLSYLDRIEQESNRLSEMIGQILQIQRLQLANTPHTKSAHPLKDKANNNASFAPIELMALLHHIGEDVQFEFQNKNIELHINEHPPLSVFGNVDGLSSALENITRNAFLHTPTGGKVSIDVSELIADEDMPNNTSLIQITIQDEGGGISEADRHRLFEPFVRLDSARSRHSQSKSKDGGYGLGLAIAKAVIDAHGGTIEAKNVRRDEQVIGLKIQINLPSA